MKKETFIIENLGCAHCAGKMEAKLRNHPDIENASLTFATKQLTITAKHPSTLLPVLQEICQSIESQVTIHRKDEASSNEEHESKYEFPFFIAGATIFIIALLTKFLWLGDSLPVMILFIVSYLILGGSVLLEAGKNILHGQIFDENFLMSIATLGAFAIGDCAEAAGVMLFFSIGELFEHHAVEKSRKAIMDAVDMRPETVQLVKNDSVMELPAEMATPGDIILVRAGDHIPLDGIITEGSTRIDTSPVTGEPVPVHATVGSNVISGCLNTSGVIKVRVTNGLQNSMVTKILDAVENAAAGKPQIDRFITRFSKVYTPIVVAIALLTAIVPSLITGDWAHYTYTALTFLVISCPCALVLSVPLAFFSGIGLGSRHGILFKGGSSLEAMMNINAVVMDKTGTITEGSFRVTSVQPSDGISSDELLRTLALAEQQSTHPIAQSIMEHIAQNNIEVTSADSIQEIAGKGILATYENNTILCGTKDLLLDHKIRISSQNTPYGTQIYVAKGTAYLGTVTLSDQLKKNTISAIQSIKNLGLKTIMLTGDNEDAANQIGQTAGLDEVHAKLLPTDKLNELQKIQSSVGAVMYVGDGINDALVLAGANVGAAMGSGSDAAIDAADVVFMTSDMDAIPTALAIARQTTRTSRANIAFALVIKALIMILGLLGFANMWLAVFADSGVAMLCVLNAVRILKKKSFK